MSSPSPERPPQPQWDYKVIRDRLTHGRLESYLTASGQDLDLAFALYEWNMRASAAALLTIGMVEVVVRNALDQQLVVWAEARQPSSSWFDAAPLDAKGRQDIAKARTRAARAVTRPAIHGKVIAELSIGFWRYLVASRYLTSLWIPATHRGFPDGDPDLRVRRVEVEHHLQRLAFVRNRAAHHEPIHRRDLLQDLASAVELTSWVCRDCALWVADTSTIADVVRQRPQLPALPSEVT